VRAEIREVRRTADGWIGSGPMLDENKMVLGKTRVAIRLDTETGAQCLDAILKGAARVETFKADDIVEIALTGVPLP
jgi:hypothetical protein